MSLLKYDDIIQASPFTLSNGSVLIFFPEKTETSFNQDLLVNALEAEEPGLYDNPKATNQSPTTNGSLDPFDMGKSGPQIKVPKGKLFFLFLNQNICCGYSKEPSH